MPSERALRMEQLGSAVRTGPSAVRPDSTPRSATPQTCLDLDRVLELYIR